MVDSTFADVSALVCALELVAASAGSASATESRTSASRSRDPAGMVNDAPPTRTVPPSAATTRIVAESPVVLDEDVLALSSAESCGVDVQAENVRTRTVTRMTARALDWWRPVKISPYFQMQS